MINKAILLGRIGKKDTKKTKNNNDLTSIAIATSRKWIDSQGQKQENTTWHHVHCFNKLAEIVKKYAHVGDLIYIEGKIHNNKIFKDNQEKWVYSVTAQEIKLLPNSNKKQTDEEFNHNFSNEIPF